MKSLALGIVIGASVSQSYKSVFQSTDKTIKKIGDSITQTNAKFNASKNVIKYKKTLEELKTKQTQLGGSNKKLSTGIKKVENRYKQAKKEAKAYGIEIGSIVKEHNRLGTSLTKLGNKQKRYNKMAQAKENLGAIKGKFLGFIGGAYAATRTIGSAITQEQATIRLATVVDKKSLEKAKKFAREYSQNNITNETEMINIQYALNSAGLGNDASMIGSTIVEKVAKVTGGVVFNNMSSSIEGNTKEKLQRIGDILTKTQLKFQIRNFGQLGESMAKGAKGAVKYKVALDQTAAVLGQLNTAGVQGSLAGTSFNAMLRQMTRASEDLGFEIIRNANGNMDFVATIENIKEAMSDITDIDEYGDLIQKAFGDEGGAISLLIDNLDKLKANYKDIKKSSSGVVDNNYKKFKDSTGGQFAIFSNNIKLIGTAFSETLFPAINMVLKPITQFAKLVTNGIRDYPIIGTIIGGIAAGIGVYAAGVGIATAAQWAMNAAMLANPIGLVVAGLVVGATAIYHYWGNIKEFFIAIWNGIKNVFGEGIAFVFKTIKAVTSLIPDKFLPESMQAKSLDATIKKYQSIGDIAKETAIDKKADEESINQDFKEKAQKVASVVSATMLAANIATATPQQKKINKTITISAPITVQASSSPEQTAKTINEHLQQLQGDSYIQIDGED